MSGKPSVQVPLPTTDSSPTSNCVIVKRQTGRMDHECLGILHREDGPGLRDFLHRPSFRQPSRVDRHNTLRICCASAGDLKRK